jgi:hypothetical protein
MRKKLALLLAGVMVATIVPVTAMAGTTTNVNKTITVSKGGTTNETSLLTIKDGDGAINKAITSGDVVKFVLDLDGSEWLSDAADKVDNYDQAADIIFNRISATKATVEIIDMGTNTDNDSVTANQWVYVPLFTSIKNKGEITVTVDPAGSVVSGGTYTYAVCVSGAATAKVAGTKPIPEDGAKIKDITITETTAGALKAGTLKLKLSKNFKFGSIIKDDVVDDEGDVIKEGNYISVLGDDIVGEIVKVADREIEIEIKDMPRSRAAQFVLRSLPVIPDDAKVGAVADITISGAGITKTTLEVGTYTEYGTKVSIFNTEDDVPVFYSGKVYTSDDKVTLGVLISEVVANSLNTGRKLTFTFPEGVKVVTAYTIDKYSDEAGGIGGSGVYAYETGDKDAWSTDAEVPLADNVSIKNNVVTIKKINVSETVASKMTFAFNLAISPEFTGDIDVTVGGAAIDVEETLTVAKAKAPFTVEAGVNEVAIDYRNVAVSDIVIKEADPGAFKDDERLVLGVENMQFEKGMDYEITTGDIDIKDFRVNGGAISMNFKEESAKTAGEIKLSNAELFLDRALPAGDYDLIAITEGTRLFDACNFAKNGNGDVYFDLDDITLVKGYIKVVTAGRDKDDATFTTKIVVPIGSKTIKAGEKEIEIDVPAFINADGYTMMPLRAVVEALSGAAIVTWDTETKTATVLFGARVISMTIGQKHMKINGVDVAMQAAPIIVESRTFLPLRDLGYALGLNESQVNWDNDTKTATLN